MIPLQPVVFGKSHVLLVAIVQVAVAVLAPNPAKKHTTLFEKKYELLMIAFLQGTEPFQFD
jgi:hypothetical protein